MKMTTLKTELSTVFIMPRRAADALGPLRHLRLPLLIRI